jgi:uncharacterized membrane protein (DUF485 family)
MNGSKDGRTILKDPEFQRMVRMKNGISLTLTLVQLVLYFGFIMLVAYAGRTFLAAKITASTPLGIPIAVGTILLSWFLTGFYIRWANSTYDPMIRTLRDRMGE